MDEDPVATQPSSKERSTWASQLIKAPREAVYRAFLDPDAVAAWLPPDGMTGRIHTFEPHKGGRFRLSLTYLDPSASPRGKTSEDTDTVQGTFAQLLSNEKIVWVTQFDSPDPNFAGEMTITWTFADAPGGTQVTALSENIPPGIRLEDNEMGSRQSLRKLAAFLERGDIGPAAG
jgi:uncharacterized protein YndB with AHSA1/START domain